jgi:hypothetical protein
MFQGIAAVGHHRYQALDRICFAVLIQSNADPQSTLLYVTSPFTASSHHQYEEAAPYSRQAGSYNTNN